jgi:hypothetical protein
MRLKRLLGSLGRRQRPAPDPTWQALRSTAFVCGSCNETHHLPFDIAFSSPDFPDLPPLEANSALRAALSAGRDFLSQDFCLNGPDRMIRTLLPFAIVGTDARFAFGVWSSVSPKAFERFAETFDSPRQGDEMELVFSWLCNDLRGAPPRSDAQPSQISK